MIKRPSGQKITNWNHFPAVDAHVFNVVNTLDCVAVNSKERKMIARGLGRSYGDASLGDNIISLSSMNRFLSFDKKQGILHARSGVSLDEILKVIVPSGWFLPVTPGTKFVTLGGAVAADVHGKNHHIEGAFSKHIIELELLTAESNVVLCSKDQNSELFKATCGGMGLTGVILSVKLQLKPVSTSFIYQKNFKASNLEEIFTLFEKHIGSTYSVAWIDCLASGKNLGRSVLMIGEHATPEQLTKNSQISDPLQLPSVRNLNMPFYWPPKLLNRLSVKAFNLLYFYKQSRLKDAIVSYEPFFYPLDGILNWNRMYGRKGFLQYQFVLPREKSFDGIKQILEKVSSHGSASFLTVLKLLGAGENYLSFPMKGYTLAMDFPVNPAVFTLLSELDEIVDKNGGRIYLAKDARMESDFFHKGYAGLSDFKNIKQTWDQKNKYSSKLSERLKI